MTTDQTEARRDVFKRCMAAVGLLALVSKRIDEGFDIDDIKDGIDAWLNVFGNMSDLRTATDRERMVAFAKWCMAHADYASINYDASLDAFLAQEKKL
jgi:hypothetical protein